MPSRRIFAERILSGVFRGRVGVAGTAPTLWGQRFTGGNVDGDMTGVGSITATGPVTITNTAGPQFVVQYDTTHRLRLTMASTGWPTYTLDDNTYRHVFEQALHVGTSTQNNNGVAIINNTGGGFLHFYTVGLAVNNRRWIWTPGEIRASNDDGDAGTGVAPWSATRSGLSITAADYRATTHTFRASAGTVFATLTASGLTSAVDVVPSTTGARDVGSDTTRWRSGYFSTSVATPKLSNAAPPHSTMTASAGVTLTGDASGYAITAGAAIAQWGEQVYSDTGFAGAALMSATVPVGGKLVMMGLSSNPTATASYTGIDYAIHLSADSKFHVFESGVLRQTYTTYAVGDVFAVRYSGTSVLYQRNGVTFRTSTVAAGQTLYFDSSFDDGAQLSAVTFTDGSTGGGDGTIDIDSHLVPTLTNSVSLGTTSLRWKDAWFSGTITGNLTGNVTGSAATVTDAAQPAITSVGTLTGLMLSGDLTLVGGLVSYGANDSGGAGFRQVLVPNA